MKFAKWHNARLRTQESIKFDPLWLPPKKQLAKMMRDSKRIHRNDRPRIKPVRGLVWTERRCTEENEVFIIWHAYLRGGELEVAQCVGERETWEVRFYDADDNLTVIGYSGSAALGRNRAWAWARRKAA